MVTKQDLFRKIADIIMKRFPDGYEFWEDIIEDLETMCQLAYDDAYYGYGFATFSNTALCKQFAEEIGELGQLVLKAVWTMGWSDCAEDMNYQREKAEEYMNKFKNI